MNRVQIPSIVLTRKISLVEYEMEGVIEEQRERNDIAPFLQYIADQNENGKNETTARDMAEHLLGEHSRTHAVERILSYAESLQLLDSSEGKWLLTEEGKSALERGKIFIPRRGVFSVWVVNDAEDLKLFEQFEFSPIIEISDILAGKKFWEELKQLNKTKGQLPPAAQVPSCLSPDNIDLKEKRKRVRVIEPDKLCKTEKSKVLIIQCYISRGEICISLEKENETIKQRMLPLNDDEKIQILNQILSAEKLSSWKSERGVPISFERAKEEYGSNAIKNFNHEPEIEVSMDQQRFSFRSKTLKDVPVFPETDGDERHWVDYLFRDKLNGYLTADKQNQIVREISETGRFSSENITQGVPSRNSLIEEYRESDTRKFWWTVAPEDWSL